MILPRDDGKPRYYVVKVAGDNNHIVSPDQHGCYNDRGEHDVDCFVAGNGHFVSKRKAVEFCAKLATESPGNRYYICLIQHGMMVTAPQLEAANYAGDGQ